MIDVFKRSLVDQSLANSEFHFLDSKELSDVALGLVATIPKRSRFNLYFSSPKRCLA